ncbi:MAG: SAM-dependent methyltransferase [Hyphomicrobiales bacterium]|nr:MAG: SAM-dependent methyltransferase [Hyphomicrobiales bacterium]
MHNSKKTISTARGVALVRAIEMTRPASQRVASDPYAHRFCNPLSVQGMRLVNALGISRLIGVEPMMNFAIVRERAIEALMQRELADGLGQIVILGAGYDTRAYRLGTDVPVFEVDHPLTQANKREALKGVVDPLPQNVRFVGVDFDHDDLGERLSAEGFDAHKRTLFVWQGVTMYLTAAGVDHTLAFVANRAAAGSVIVFDYYDNREVSQGGGATIRFFTALMGEKTTFGIDAGDIEGFLTRRGFVDVQDDGPEAMARPYFTGPNAGRPMAPGVHIATARVP